MTMKTISKKYSFMALFFTVLMFSCNDLTDLNENPNGGSTRTW